MRINIFRITIIIAVALSSSIRAQTLRENIVYKSEAERAFMEAMKLYQTGRFDTAAALYVYTIREYPGNHRATAALIMGGKAYYELKNHRESIRLLKDLIDLYPHSSYIDDAHYTLGLNYYRMARYEDASSEFIAALQLSSEPRLVERSRKLLETLTSSNLTIPELQLLQSDAKSDEMKALITLRLAEKTLHAGDIATANEMLHKVAELPANIKYVSQALALLEETSKRGAMKIGIVLPLMLKSENPTLRVFGMDFLQGIQLAIDEYNQTALLKVSFEVRDTERDQSIAARQVADLCNDDNISVIIGPILSNEVYASAGIANERGVPLVSPTATAKGIAAIGPFIFQANPDYDIQGRDVAAYAYNILGARKFTILSPDDAVRKQMVESFIDEIKTLGGEIMDIQWYGVDSKDMRTELTAMRRKALEKLEIPSIDFSAKMRQSELNKIIRWGVDQHVLDSLIERKLMASVKFLFGERGGAIADSLKLPTHLERVKHDSLGLPVENIDAIFIPIASSDEIPIVSSQLKYFNIQTQVLGTGDWNDLSTLDQNRQYTDGTMFAVDSYINPESEAYKSFVARYLAANKNTPPGTNALFGYDVAKMIVEIVSQGKTRRSDIAAALARVEEFAGLHSKLSLSLNRVNSYLTILQYKGRRILRVGEIDLSRLGK